MINKQLVSPKSIVVVGASNDVCKPGGKILKNLIDGNFSGNLYAINLKEDLVQGIKSYKDINKLPNVDLAVIAIAAKYCPATVDFLVNNKTTKAFIIISAGFGEENEQGAKYEQQIVDTINKVNGCLIGPNCIGVLNTNYNGIFTTPIPKLSPKGVDLISGSGATAVFIMETALPKGLTFNSVYSVGNSAQMGVEEVLQYLDQTYNPETSSQVKLLYIEDISKPQKLLKHASSLINKGCKIAAIKSGSSEAGSRAASSHTGALASPDVAVDALFRKAGIVRCYGREELVTVASIFKHKQLTGKNIALITHAGGPAVMLTDSLSKGGLNIPHIHGEKANQLLEKLYDGSSVANPIDFLATGTAQQLADIIDYCENDFDNIDAMVVIFGSPGLTKVFDVYEVLHQKMKTCKKPIYPVLPSTFETKEEIFAFQNQGHQSFNDEVILGDMLCKVFNTPKPQNDNIELIDIDTKKIREIVENAGTGYISPKNIQALFDAVGIPRTKEAVAKTKNEAVVYAKELGLPVVMKVIGPVHKSDVGGVVLNVKTEKMVELQFEQMMQIKDTTSILIQPMLSGIEIYAGAKKEGEFGHQILCGLGGIFIEVFKDVSSALAPVSHNEAMEMIKSLKSYKIIEGTRGKEGINEQMFADVVVRLSALVKAAPEIIEMDINPLLGTATKIIAVDARIRL